jgi:hypothetical protein
MWDFSPDNLVITLQQGAGAPAIRASTPPGLPPPGPVLAQGDALPAAAGASPLYLVLYREDREGLLRHKVVPLVPEPAARR